MTIVKKNWRVILKTAASAAAAVSASHKPSLAVTAASAPGPSTLWPPRFGAASLPVSQSAVGGGAFAACSGFASRHSWHHTLKLPSLFRWLEDVIIVILATEESHAYLHVGGVYQMNGVIVPPNG